MSWLDAIHRANVSPSGNGLATILQAQKNSYVGLQYQTRTDYSVEKDYSVDQTFCTLYTFAASCVLIGGQQRTWYYVKKVRQVRDSKEI